MIRMRFYFIFGCLGFIKHYFLVLKNEKVNIYLLINKSGETKG